MLSYIEQPDGSQHQFLLVVETLQSFQDTNSIYAPNGVPLFDEIYTRPVPEDPTVEEIVNATDEFIGQDSGDVFALLSLGYNFDGFREDVPRQGDPSLAEGLPIFSVPNFYGMHGYDSNLPEMQAIFLAAEPDFNPSALEALKSIRTIDIAPTILDLLDVETAPTVDGESIFEQAQSSRRNLESSRQPINSVFGSLDTDTLEVGGSEQLVFAGAGDDFIDASSSEGSRVFAGAGDDIAILGSRDHVVGGKGDDRFFAQTGGDNTVTGGEGADQFWIGVAEIPEAVNTVTDFTTGEDVIGIAGMGITEFAQSNISQQDGGAALAVNGNELAILRGIDASSLDADYFAFG